MSHSNSTQNYGLPQFVASDKPAWLTDINSAYADIDTGIHNAQAAADDAQDDATQALSDASTALATASSADAKASGANASIASAFETTAVYSVGDRVVYNGLLYACIVAVNTPGPWTGSANWSRVNIDDLINDTNSKIGDLSDLTTSDNTSLVNAVNEVNDAISVKSNQLIVERKTITINLVNANYGFTQVDISKPGYAPLGIVGTQTQSIGLYFFRANLASAGAATAVIGLSTRDTGAVTQTVDTFIDVLYVKN